MDVLKTRADLARGVFPKPCWTSLRGRKYQCFSPDCFHALSIEPITRYQQRTVVNSVRWSLLEL